MIVAGTGHRPDKLPMGFHSISMDVMKRAVRLRMPMDVTEVVSGLALGWDTALALVALEDGIPLTAAVPFRGQENRWRPSDQQRYRQILRRARHTEVVSPGGYSAVKMQARNMWMVDYADVILSLWDGTDGGTANCVRYAESEGVLIIDCWAAFVWLSRRYGEKEDPEWALL